IGDPRSPKMQSVLNLKIKFRESFRPFAPSVLREKVADYFELDGDSPYMLLVAGVRKDRRLEMSSDQKALWGIDLLNVPRSDIPRRHPHRLLGAHPDDSRGHEPALLRPAAGVRASDGLRGAGEHVFQRPRRADCRIARGRLPLLHAHGDGRAGPA